MSRKAKLTVNELFSGIGAQRKALERIGIEHEIIGISEIDKFAIQSYEAIFGPTFNYGDITKIKRLKYADLWTYSFPCTDISVAGKQEGINSNTRSGLLYEVQRLLNIAKNDKTLPKFLLLENVKNLVGKKFKEQFNDWLEYLDKMGYNTYWQVLNAKDYGIPQNRERVYGISIRKDIDTQKFKFPEKEILQKRLVDILEKDVDESFYLKQKTIDYFINNSLNNEKKGNGFRFKPHNPSAAEIAFAVTTRSGTRMDDNYLLNKNIGDKPFFNFNKEGLLEVREATHKGYSLADIGDSINIEQPNSKTRRGRVGKNIAQTILTAPKQVTIVASRGRNPQNPSDRKKGANLKQRLEFNSQGISNTLTTVQKDNLVLEKQILQVGTIPEEILKDNERQRRIYSPEGISPTVLARQDSPKIIQAGNIVKSGNWENPQRGRIYSPEGISPTINTRQGGGLEPKVIIDDTVGYDGIRTYENYAPTLRASRTGLKVNENIRIRKLTPLECWRLMGFDDIDLTKAKAVGVSNTQLYKQAGNSIVVNVLEKIFNNLFQ